MSTFSMCGEVHFIPTKYHNCPIYIRLSSLRAITLCGLNSQWCKMRCLFAIYLLCIGHLQDQASRQCYYRRGKARKSESRDNFHSRRMSRNYRYESGTACCSCCLKELFHLSFSFFYSMPSITVALYGGGSENEKFCSGET